MLPTVLITGASQGCGKATALLFARKGYNIVLAARTLDKLVETANEVRANGSSALAIPTDVTDAKQVEYLVQKAIDFYGKIDVLVNNAGICLTGAMEHTTLEDFQQLMNVNFFGYVNTIKALLPNFLSKKSGTIVNVGSIGGKMPLPQMTAYCASKYAVTGLTDTLRLELQPKGINVISVHPGVINSDFMERAQFRGGDNSEVESSRQQMNSVLTSSFVSQPKDIAEAIWNAVKNNQSEVVVGPAVLATETYRLFPGLVQFMMGKSLG
ncbi:SDR family oxidoreductase [Okeania sp. SIO1I7]|uniref:SDR family oxidoreductase n=1 Tax=Okeania sp. SIO1I7 TaxID=2607772 RepID=UPI0013FA898F|nr:SDR family oxidoreductase [Okeania sp. SIO1I7]NET26710.1 SDR family oxidoreductase [Okeania sp. SIO1I7]